MIRTESLTKRFGATVAIDRMTVSVPYGSVVGVLGPSGAGKSTLLRLLVGLVRPSGGAAWVLGHDVAKSPVEIRRSISFVAESKELYLGPSVAEFAAFYASFYPDADSNAALALLTRWGVDSNDKADALSRGARTKVLLATALSRRPELAILDEPCDGLDPGAVEDVWATLMERVGSDSGAGVVLSSHRLEEVERVCDRIIVLNRGRMILEGELDDLRSSWRRLLIKNLLPSNVSETLPDIVAHHSHDGVVEAITSAWDSSYAERLPAHAEIIDAHGMSMREIYLTVVGHER